MPGKSGTRAVQRFARRAGLWQHSEGRHLIGFWGAASSRTPQSKPARSKWRATRVGSLLLAAVAIVVVVRQIIPADKAAVVGTDVVANDIPGTREAAPPSERQNSAPEPVVRKPKVQASAPTATVPLHEVQQSRPETAARQPEAPTAKPEAATRLSEVQTPGPKIAMPSPEPQKSRSDVAASLPEAPTSKPDMTARQPEAQQSPTIAAPSTEVQKQKADMAAPLSEAPKSKAETAMRQPEPQTSGLNTAPSLPEAQKSKPDMVASLPEAEKPTPEPAVRQSEVRTAKREGSDVAVPQLVLSADVAKKIGQKIWLNETGGKTDAITSWNANEEFASLGIGHFIWFPVGKWLPFEESFPQMLEFLRKGNVRLPAWLDKPQIPALPWTSRDDFKRNFNSPEMRELRQFLLDTVAEQTEFMVARAQSAMDKILKNTPDSAERAHIIAQFSRVVRASDDLYPLIDYINFKGEGTNPKETAVDKQTGSPQGWGLKQVLLKMNGASGDSKTVLADYADAVQQVLQQRIRNLPSNRIWEAGWLRRVDTYRRPLAEAAPESKRAQDEVLPARAAR
jgi:hypothetical protein